ncbi:hypothetical protein DMB66_00035 [Actinoplanes sp. ATCC 53533]|uniref:hypothetical protein n=1 Tax=Actinoplanes sp. ATCC 53533 TaxID=1288362 RepID=UPI000F78BF4F|nr:hypothetical protein [Actinoplanes sp. ATCC 53533]RSM75194.1 hypothetical protein DMB66_00035 [Actinoplanes sp. ATCC 53533]
MTRLTVALATIALVAAGCAPRPRPDPGAVSWPPAPSASADTEDGPNPPIPTPAPAAATDAALRFVHAWARPGLAQPTWYAALRDLVTPAYAQLLAATDPANVPAHLVTGAPAARSSTSTVLVTDVPTDAGTVRVTLTRVDGRWLVATVAEVSIR